MEGKTKFQGLKGQQGFTLIELIMVIVILGILAAVAIPKYVDLQAEAAAASVEGVYGGVLAASAVNHAAVVIGKPVAERPAYDGTVCTTGLIIATGIDGGNCIVNALGGAVPNGWAVAGDTITTTINATTYTITITSDETTTDAAIIGKSW